MVYVAPSLKRRRKTIMVEHFWTWSESTNVQGVIPAEVRPGIIRKFAVCKTSCFGFRVRVGFFPSSSKIALTSVPQPVLS